MEDQDQIIDGQFYRAFEDRYRGSRDLIKERLAIYLPFVKPLQSIYLDATAVDLGCGRGEWLELLVSEGFHANGVDLDLGMLESSRQLGLRITHGDALEYLASLADDSQVVVSAFHVVEHLPFHGLQRLVKQALRVLKPGGVLIMETPNPENLVVATRNFFLDPTHQRPIPPGLLSFVPEYYGYARVKTVRLQESPGLRERASISLLDVLEGASPDYAVIAQKQADPEIMQMLDRIFLDEYGLTLESLASRYDEKIGFCIDKAETKAQQAETKAQQAETKAQQAETKAQQAETKAQQAETKAQQAETKAQQAETKAQQAEVASNELLAQLHAVYASTSWRITKPLRAIKRFLSGDVSVLGRSTAAVKLKAKQIFRPLVASGIAYVKKKPALRNRLKRVLAKFPALHQRLLRVAMNEGAFRPASLKQCALSPELHAMAPRTRQIYRDLKAAIENKNKGAV